MAKFLLSYSRWLDSSGKNKRQGIKRILNLCWLFYQAEFFCHKSVSYWIQKSGWLPTVSLRMQEEEWRNKDPHQDQNLKDRSCWFFGWRKWCSTCSLWQLRKVSQFTSNQSFFSKRPRKGNAGWFVAKPLVTALLPMYSKWHNRPGEFKENFEPLMTSMKNAPSDRGKTPFLELSLNLIVWMSCRRIPVNTTGWPVSSAKLKNLSFGKKKINVIAASIYVQ